MKRKISFLYFLFFSCITQAQEKFDYITFKDTSAIVIYKMMYDTLQNGAFLIGSNIYCNGKYYPLADNGRSIMHLSQIGLFDEPQLKTNATQL